MKWYQKPIWIIVLLVLFFPVGIFLLWKYTNWNKNVKIALSILSVILTIGVLSGGDKNKETETTTTTYITTTEATSKINSIVFSHEKDYLYVGEECEGYIEIDGDTANKDLINLYSSNENVATIEYIERTSYFNDLYFVIKGVSEGTAIIRAETTDGTVQSYEVTVNVEAETTTEEPETEEDTGTTVYITPTGEKYHFSKSCAGKNAIPKQMDEVSSYDPCKKCAY